MLGHPVPAASLTVGACTLRYNVYTLCCKLRLEGMTDKVAEQHTWRIPFRAQRPQNHQ